MAKVTFDNPPINEVVIAIYFNPQLVDFRSQHVGRFWERIEDEFPFAHQQVPVGIGPHIDSEEPFPMPRYWFVARDQINLVQVQKDAFLFNWRRRGNGCYPGFIEEVKPTFDRLYAKFESFLREVVDVPGIAIDICELTYVDVIEQSDYWQGPEDTHNVIPSFSTLSLSAGELTNNAFDCNYSYLAKEDFALSFRVRTMVDRDRSEVPALLIETKASTRFVGVAKSATDEWFVRAHDTILDNFVKMTNEDVQRHHWGRRTENAG